MAQAVSFEKRELRARLKAMGISDNQLEELTASFDKKNRHLDVITFVSMMDRFGASKGKVYSFLKDAGIDDPTLISVYSRADLKKAGLDESRVQEVVFSD